MIENYYISQKNKLLKGFERASNWFRPNLTEDYGRAFADEVAHEARNEYGNLISQIPYIGGSKVHMTSDLMESVLQLAFLKTFKSRGISIEDSRDLLMKSMQTRIAQYPKLLLKVLGWMTFSKHTLRNLQRQAEESQRRKYPGGFVFEVLIGDGEEFDWGLNFQECAICKFFQAQNESELLPIVCSIDYALSDAFGYGLVRTKTLAEGNDICNPRMKRGRRTEWRLSRE